MDDDHKDGEWRVAADYMDEIIRHSVSALPSELAARRLNSALHPFGGLTAEEMTTLMRDHHGSDAMEKMGSGKTGFSDLYLGPLERALKSRPTPLQDPNWYGLLIGLSKEIEKQISDRKIKLPKRIMFGSMPTGRVNGIAVALPNCNYWLILIEEGLFGFANLISKAVVQPLLIEQTSDRQVSLSLDRTHWQSQIDNNFELVWRFVEFILAYLIQGDPHAARPYLISRERSYFAGLLRHSMELFVVGHEYGHCISGHFTEGSPTRSMFPNGGPAAKEILTSWRQEHEADLRGLEFALNEEGDVRLSFCGCDAFFQCIQLISNTVSILKYGELREVEPSETHPPAQMRQEVIKKALKTSLSEVDYNNIVGFAESLGDVYAYYWQKMMPIFVDMHNRGVRPLPIW